MRTSGGGRDNWMTVVPIGLLVFFLVMASGGPAPFLRGVEATLRSFFEWVRGIV